MPSRRGRSGTDGIRTTLKPEVSSPGRDPSAPLAQRNDQLELIIAAARLGYCLLDFETGEARANSLFKAEFGWPPYASVQWPALEQRVSP